MGLKRVVSAALISVFMATGMAVAQGAQSGGPSIVQRVITALTTNYVAAQVRRGTPTAERWLGGSPGSIGLLHAYKASDLYTVADLLLRKVEPEGAQWLLAGPENMAGQKAEATVSDKFAQVRGFKVEISGSSGKEVDTAWECSAGGELVIEHTESSIGSDKFATTSPGHKSPEDLTLNGAFAALLPDIEAWIGCPEGSRDCIPPRGSETVSLTLIGDEGKVLGSFRYQALAAAFIKNELLIVWIEGDLLHATVFTVGWADGAGAALPSPPRIFLLLPSAARGGESILIAGSDVPRREAAVTVNGTPAPPLNFISGRQIPLIGSFTVGSTIVPVAAPSGAGAVRVEYKGQQSNPYPFTKN